MIDNTVVIIRSAGERTELLCKKLVLEQGVPDAQVMIVRESPFSAAMHRSFELGVNSGCKYTFCVDADVLLRPGSILYMVRQFEGQPENICEIQGLVMDKFFGGPRPGGNHLYKSSLLPEVIKRIPREGVDIRPEYYTLKSMAADGFAWLGIPYVVGLHDDEQYYSDIYRKCFVHADKHVHLADLFSAVWKENMDTDADYEIALRAFADGFQYRGALFIDKDQAVYKDGFDRMSYGEKDELDVSSIDLDVIEKKISNWREHPVFLLKFPSRFGLGVVENGLNDARTPGIFQRIGNRLANKGLIKFLAFALAWALLRITNRLMKFSDET